MPEVSILEQLRKLVEIQKIDAEIYQCKRELKEKPAYLNELKEQFEGKKATLQAEEDRYKAVQVDRNTREGDLKVKEEEIAKSNTQLSQIKTNKEYTAKITEIENIKADKSIIEEKILLLYDEADQIKADIAKEKEALSVEEKKYLADKKEIDDSIRQVQDRIKVLEAQRQQIAPDIDKSNLDRYEKILVNKDGLAIVPVQGSVCGGCYMDCPPQMINEIKMHDKLIYCEMCARILYLEEDL